MTVRWGWGLVLVAACSAEPGTGGNATKSVCSAPLASCSGACVDTDIDARHCGACDNTCDEGELCADGLCAVVCFGGSAACGDKCVDTRVDPDNCGGCGLVCNSGKICSEGECVLDCVGGTNVCGNECVDTSVDPQHCGDCDTVCQASDDCRNGLCCAVGQENCGGACVDTMSDTDHCGGCNTGCASSDYCVDGDCVGAAPDCKAILAADRTAGNGGYLLDPDGKVGPELFEAYCEMQLAGGGWTLIAKITNGDGAKNWAVHGGAWVEETSFGDATDVVSNLDAKSPAYYSVPIDELMIVRAPAVVEVRSGVGCLAGATLANIFQQNSTPECAHTCTTVGLAPPWSGQANQDDTLKFRCRDNTEVSNAHGYEISLSDNSMLTTLVTSQVSITNFGFGAGQGLGGSMADFDPATTDGADENADTSLRYVFGR